MSSTAVTQESIDLIHQFTTDVWNGGDLGRIEDLVSPDVVQHGPVSGMTLNGPEEIRANIEQYQAAFSDLESTVDLVFCDETGEYVAAHFTVTGTHDGELMGIDPTDTEGTVEVVSLYRIEDGHIAESWSVADMYSLFHQIGEQPAAGPLAP